MSRTNPALRVESLEDRLAPAAGDLDPTFGNGGVVTLPDGQTFGAFAPLPDGGVVAVTGQTSTTGPALVRFNPDGTPDPGFGTGGQVSFPDEFGPVGVAAQPDGRVVVAGRLGFTDPAADIAVIRFTPTGQPDPTFDGDGEAVFGSNATPALDQTTGVALGPDGSVVVFGQIAGGLAEKNRTFAPYQIFVFRLTPAGQLDPTFGAGGRVQVGVPVNGFNTTNPSALSVGADGFIAIAGSAVVDTYEYSVKVLTATGTVTDPVLIRLRADGALDPGFGAGGVLRVPITPGAREGQSFYTVSARPDGRVLVAGLGPSEVGAIGYRGVATMFTAAGQPDPSYGTGGTATTPVTGAYGATIDADGRVVFSGGNVIRLTANGQLDPQFGSGGVVDVSQVRPSSGVPFSGGARVGPDGNILLSGGETVPPSPGATLPIPGVRGILVRLIGYTPPAGFVPSSPGTIQAGGSADGTVRVLKPTDGTYAVAGTMATFPGLPLGVRTATADVNGDGTPDYIDGAGPGALPTVFVIDGKTGALLTSPLAFEPTFAGGVFVAAGDLDGDGRAEIVVAPDQGGGPHVVVLSLNPDRTITTRASFFALGNPDFRGGARPAVGDLNGDGTPDVAVGAGFLGGPNVEIHDGKAIVAGDFAKQIGSGFFAFDGPDAQTLRNGVYLAIGDLNGDGFADLIAGGGPGGGPRVLALDGKMLAAGDVSGAYAAPVANFFVGSGDDRGGVRVATTNADGDGKADLVIGSGERLASRVRVYLGKNFTGTDEPAFQDLDPFGQALPGGVFVG